MSDSQTFDLMIVAAGNGTRMGDTNIPKILTKINGYPNLWNTLDKWRMVPSRGKTYLVVNNRNGHLIEQSINDYFKHVEKSYPFLSHSIVEDREHIKIIKIESGLGDGHAVLTALHPLPISNFFFVVWGDAYFTSWNIFEDCIDEYRRKNQEGYSMYDLS